MADEFDTLVNVLESRKNRRATRRMSREQMQFEREEADRQVQRDIERSKAVSDYNNPGAVRLRAAQSMFKAGVGQTSPAENYLQWDTEATLQRYKQLRDSIQPEVERMAEAQLGTKNRLYSKQLSSHLALRALVGGVARSQARAMYQSLQAGMTTAAQLIATHETAKNKTSSAYNTLVKLRSDAMLKGTIMLDRASMSARPEVKPVNTQEPGRDGGGLPAPAPLKIYGPELARGNEALIRELKDMSVREKAFTETMWAVRSALSQEPESVRKFLVPAMEWGMFGTINGKPATKEQQEAVFSDYAGRSGDKLAVAKGYLDGLSAAILSAQSKASTTGIVRQQSEAIEATDKAMAKEGMQTTPSARVPGLDPQVLANFGRGVARLQEAMMDHPTDVEHQFATMAMRERSLRDAIVATNGQISDETIRHWAKNDTVRGLATQVALKKLGGSEDYTESLNQLRALEPELASAIDTTTRTAEVEIKGWIEKNNSVLQDKISAMGAGVKEAGRLATDMTLPENVAMTKAFERGGKAAMTVPTPMGQIPGLLQLPDMNEARSEARQAALGTSTEMREPEAGIPEVERSQSARKAEMDVQGARAAAPDEPVGEISLPEFPDISSALSVGLNQYAPEADSSMTPWALTTTLAPERAAKAQTAARERYGKFREETQIMMPEVPAMQQPPGTQPQQKPPQGQPPQTGQAGQPPRQAARPQTGQTPPAGSQVPQRVNQQQYLS